LPDRNTGRCRDHPPLLIRLVPHLHQEGGLRGMSCKFGLASCRSNSSTRKYAAELAPHKVLDAS
jgi:hypothetical protein